jgi:hypothetical protein
LLEEQFRPAELSSLGLKFKTVLKRNQEYVFIWKPVRKKKVVSKTMNCLERTCTDGWHDGWPAGTRPLNARQTEFKNLRF